jgi:uncharacterized Zn ribbon protein
MSEIGSRFGSSTLATNKVIDASGSWLADSNKVKQVKDLKTLATSEFHINTDSFSHLPF